MQWSFKSISTGLYVRPWLAIAIGGSRGKSCICYLATKTVSNGCPTECEFLSFLHTHPWSEHFIGSLQSEDLCFNQRGKAGIGNKKVVRMVMMGNWQSCFNFENCHDSVLNMKVACNPIIVQSQEFENFPWDELESLPERVIQTACVYAFCDR